MEDRFLKFLIDITAHAVKIAMPSRQELDSLLPTSYLKYAFSDIAWILLELPVIRTSHIAKAPGSTIAANIYYTLTKSKTYFSKLVFCFLGFGFFCDSHKQCVSHLKKNPLPS